MSAEKAALLDFDVGARVYCADEEACGRLHKVVVNPHTREVTDLIVERGFLRKQERVLPVAMVERAAEDGIYTSMDMDGLSNLPEYREIEFEEPEGDWGKPHQGNMVCWSSPHGPMCHEAVVPRVRREVQEGIQSNRDVLERGTPVINSDGEMGQVDHVLVDSTTGELQIDFGGVGTAQGVNVDSVYELGDPADPTTRAFNITNQDGVAHTINLNYTVTGSTTNVVGNNHNATEFQVYDSSGSHVVTVSEEDSGASFSMASGESVAVVVVVDSTHAQIDQNDDLSGIFQVTAT